MKTTTATTIILIWILLSQNGVCQPDEMQFMTGVSTPTPQLNKSCNDSYSKESINGKPGFSRIARIGNATELNSDTLNSQPSNSLKKSEIYKVWVTKDGKNVLPEPMYLLSVNDLSISLITPTSLTEIQNGNYSILEVEVKDIDEIKMRPKNMPGLCALYGGLSLLTVSLTLCGLSDVDEDDYNSSSSVDSESTMTFGEVAAFSSIGTAIGLGVGAIIGTSKHKIKIDRSETDFLMNREYLKQCSIIK